MSEFRSYREDPYRYPRREERPDLRDPYAGAPPPSHGYGYDPYERRPERYDYRDPYDRGPPGPPGPPAYDPYDPYARHYQPPPGPGAYGGGAYGGGYYPPPPAYGYGQPPPHYPPPGYPPPGPGYPPPPGYYGHYGPPPHYRHDSPRRSPRRRSRTPEKRGKGGGKRGKEPQRKRKRERDEGGEDGEVDASDINLTLAEVFPRLVKAAQEQDGSRFLQWKLKGNCTEEERKKIFELAIPATVKLSYDQFGNFVVQKLLERGNSQDHSDMLQQVKGHVMKLSQDKFGCRVMQKMLEALPSSEKSDLTFEIQDEVVECIHDMNGNHVIQKVVEHLSPHDLGFVVSAVAQRAGEMAQHVYGCRIIQRPESLVGAGRDVVPYCGFCDIMQHGALGPPKLGTCDRSLQLGSVCGPSFAMEEERQSPSETRSNETSRTSRDGSPRRVPRVKQQSSRGSVDSADSPRRRSNVSGASFSSSASSATGSPVGRKKLSMAEFHKVQGPSETEITSFRAKVGATLRSDLLVNILTSVILIDTVCTLIATDARAMGHPPPLYVYIIGEACLGIYTLELVVGCWVEGLQHFKKPAIVFDVFTVLCGYMHAIFQLFEGVIPGELSFLKDLRLLRVIRVLRVARILQKSRSLRELQKLVAMMATCLKALGWSFLFCFGFMTLWAMLMVEFVHPLILQMHEQGGAFQDCSECLSATSSVMRANLLLFKTVIAGDSWGQVAVPVIEYSPATAIIFCGSLMTLVFGVLNMIVAVIVDSFAESRQRDVLRLAEELEHEDLNDTKYLERIFNRLDVTRTGVLTLEELVKGAQTDPEFQSRLRVMDIDQADLEQLFEMQPGCQNSSFSQ
eukprot:s22_g53.t1